MTPGVRPISHADFVFYLVCFRCDGEVPAATQSLHSDEDLPGKMRKSKSVLSVSPSNDPKDSTEFILDEPFGESFAPSSCTLGSDLRRRRRRFSGNLQLPPLSWRQGERERSRTPDADFMARPTSLPFGAPPRIDITPVDPE
ncbi:hypothetical protein NHX12_033168 [Muraenolepis orangiensis]|uniref:Uncharacterized protein n=1 Tax=Muraenolepis orangiensis TaxID=630683 RepID=A0A9Q0E252_9TELE|nr:hypothetical protein NHX12_033168 [Muraenolepis orangiensis]